MEVRRRRFEYTLRVTLGQQVYTCTWHRIDLKLVGIGDPWLLGMQLTSRVEVITEAIAEEFGGSIPPSYMRRIEWSCETVVTSDES